VAVAREELLHQLVTLQVYLVVLVVEVVDMVLHQVVELVEQVTHLLWIRLKDSRVEQQLFLLEVVVIPVQVEVELEEQLQM
jgi:hypothetical protein